MVEELLLKGARVTSEPDNHLAFAADKGSLEISRILLEKADNKTKEKASSLAVLYAAHNGYAEVANLFLQYISEPIASKALGIAVKVLRTFFFCSCLLLLFFFSFSYVFCCLATQELRL